MDLGYLVAKEAEAMIKFFFRDIKTKRPRDLEDFKAGSWVYVESPSSKEIKFLKDKFDLEEGLLRDAVDIYEVPRFEVEKGKNYIFTRFAYWQSPKIQLSAMATNGSRVESTFISTEPLLIVMTNDFLMTISLSPLPFLKRGPAITLLTRSALSTELSTELSTG